jgi:uncharacterized membrane protein YccC
LRSRRRCRSSASASRTPRAGPAPIFSPTLRPWSKIVPARRKRIQEQWTRTPIYREQVLHQEELVEGLLKNLRQTPG